MSRVAREGLLLALAGFAAELRARALAAGGTARGLKFLIPDPVRGAAKRWHLYLRWMVRPRGALDLGTWSGMFHPRELIVPLDTHWVRIGPRLGLTRRSTAGLAMALEITEALRGLDPEDPLVYDFPVCHFGIRGGCPSRLEVGHCRRCPLRPVCRTAGEAPFAHRV